MRLIALLMLIPLLAYGEVKSKIGADTVTVGVPSSGNDITFKYQDTTMATRANKTTGKLQFTNDSVAWKDFGSGDGAGGSGVNLISNPSFEDAVSIGWTNSGGTFTQESYTDNDGINTKYARFVASGSGQYFQSTVLVIPDFLTGGCLAYVGKYKTSDNNQFTFNLLDSSDNVIDSKTLTTSNGAWTGGDTSSALIPFSCPSAGAEYKIRVSSLGAGTIETDLMYFGSENRLAKISQARMAGESNFNGVSGCTHSRTSSTIGPFSTDADCLGPSIASSQIGQWQTTDSDLLRQTINNLPAGTYKATFYFKAVLSASTNSSFSIYDGSSNCTPVQSLTSNTFATPTTVSCVFNYTSEGNRSFELYASSVTGAVNITNDIAGAGIKFQLEYYPNDASTAVTNSQSEWMIDANIGGSSWTVPNSTVSSYSPIESSGWDMVLNDGSAPAEIACSSTNPSTGLTCSAGNESYSVVFTPPRTGYFRVCTDFSFSVVASAVDQLLTSQWVETANNSQTIIQEGKTRITYGGNSASAGDTNTYPVSLCGTFKFNDTSKKTLRLMYEKPYTGTGSGSILADRAAGSGQRDIHIEVKDVTSEFSRPVLTGDTLTSRGASSPDFCSAKVSATGVLSDQVGDCFSSCTNATSPVCTFVANRWKSGSVPNCWGVSMEAAGEINGRATITSTTFSQNILNGTLAAVSGSREYFCHGATK